MRYRSILRNFERRAPRPRQLITVRWVDSASSELSESWTIEGYGPPEYRLPKDSPDKQENAAPSDHKPKRPANKPPAKKKDRPQ